MRHCPSVGLGTAHAPSVVSADASPVWCTTTARIVAGAATTELAWSARRPTTAVERCARVRIASLISL
jgi:hypothetical protein